MSKVHFTVNYEGLTHIIRDEWRDWNFDWCLDVLDDMRGLPEDIKRGVLAGTYKMIANPNNPDEGQITKDTWKPKNSQCRFNKFIDPFTYQRGTRNKLILAEKTYKEIRSKIIALINNWNSEPYSIEADRILHELKNTYDKETWELVSIPWPFKYKRKVTGVRVLTMDEDLIKPFLESNWDYISPKKSPSTGENYQGISKVKPTNDVEKYIKRQIELDNMDLPKPDKNCTSPNGYIMPDGKFYPCKWMEHDWLEMKLMEKFLPKIASWKLVKVYKSQLSDALGYFIPDTPLGQRWTPTEKQLDTLMFWCAKHEVKYNE